MILIALGTIALAWSVGLPQQPSALKKYSLAVLQTPMEPPKASESEIQELQMGHLRFLEALWKQKKAVLVGPMGDPVRRGIVLLDVSRAEDATRLLAEDPFIKGGHLVPEVHTVMAPQSRLGFDGEFLDIEPLMIVWMRWDAKASEKAQGTGQQADDGTAANLRRSLEIRRDDAPLFFGVTDSTDVRLAFAVLRADSKEAALMWAKMLPPVADGQVKVEVVEFYTSKAAFRKPD